jgi:hypothetical protein
MPRWLSALMLLSWVVVSIRPAIAGSEGCCAPRLAKKAPQWCRCQTSNFRVYCVSSQATVNRLAARCEELRAQLAGIWLGEQGIGQWTKPCDVIVYPTLAGYLQVVGREAAQTAGSTLIETDGSQVVTRRIDLRGDLPHEMQSALAHELTHVIVADRIDRGMIPAWADEGMAVLADHPDKQALHLGDLQAGIRRKSTFRTAELFTLAGYPGADRMGVFYGQSGSLVSYLVHRGSPEQFVKFLELALNDGYDSALRRVYDIQGVVQLEQLWLKSVQTGELRFASHVPGQIWTKAGG